MSAKVSLSSLFADNMVLQQNTDVALWGTAEPGKKIMISSTWSKDKVTVVAGENGEWFARIATPSAGGPYELTFNDGDKLTLKNVLIGEVWICSGQSNMEMQMKGFKGQPVDGAIDLAMTAKPSTLIRSCNVKRVLAVEPKKDCEATWYEHTPEGVYEASATAYFFARKLYEVLNIPVGIINVSWGGSRIEAWMDEETLKNEFAEEIDREHLRTKVMPEYQPFKSASTLYNGMLHSVVPFTAKGFLWYQGCSNRYSADLYLRLQPSFVKMLRKKWNNEDMGFYFTQIAPYEYAGDDTGKMAAELMWAQAKSLYLIPKSAMATTHDTGERYCIHPANKEAVGNRLAYLALYTDYGYKFADMRPPIYKSMEVKGNVAYVTFDVGENGLTPTSTELDGFEIAGEDQVFYPAKGRVDANRRIVKVRCPEVQNPVAVRYGMRNWSEATLFNCFGYPASPFKTDNWK